MMNLIMRLNLIMNQAMNNLQKCPIVYVNRALLGFYLCQSRRYKCYRLNSA